MTRVFKAIVGVFLVWACFAGCDGKTDPVFVPDVPPDDKITYKSHIQEIIAAYCLKCHSVEKQGADRFGAPLGFDFDTYDDVVQRSDRMLTRMQAGTMPPEGGFPAKDLAVFIAWVNEGMPEGDSVSQQFIATSSDFSNYKRWERVEPETGTFHHYPKDSPYSTGTNETSIRIYKTRTLVDLKPSVQQYPTGTMFVVEMSQNDVIKEILAMVKRGGDYNDFHDGWEWFILYPDDLSVMERGPDLMDGLCAGCHIQATNPDVGIDYIFSLQQNPINSVE